MMSVSRRRLLVALAGPGLAGAAVAPARSREPRAAALLTVTGRIAQPGGVQATRYYQRSIWQLAALRVE